MAHKRSTRREIKRINSKRERQAEAQVIKGGHVRTIRGMGWGQTPAQPHIPDEAPNHRRSKKNKRRWCKGHVGVKHNYVLAHDDRYNCYTEKCERCGKQNWNRRAFRSWNNNQSDHWSYQNITYRLAGKPCPCDKCITPE